MNYAAHIAQLCEQLDVQHEQHVPLEGSHSSRDPLRRIATPPVTDALVYFVALHELGHIAHDHEAHEWFGITERTLEKEGEAWQWALDNAREPMTAAVAGRCVDFLSTYLIDAAEDIAVPEVTTHAYNALRIAQGITP